MLGALYRQADANDAAMTSANRRFRRNVAASCGIPHDAADDIIAGVMASRFGADERKVLGVLAAYGRARGDRHLTNEDALKVTQELQRLSELVSRQA